MRLFTLVLLGACAAAPAFAADLSFIAPDAVNPAALLPAPPATNSYETTEELKFLHQINQDSSKPQVAAALADSKNETVFLFAPAVAADFDAADFPATATLFKAVAEDGEYFEKSSKKLWQRPRPYVADTTLMPACHASKKPSFSYPSGHAIQAWTQGTVLAALLPSKAEAIKARAAAFSFEREICGVHYPTDVEAGHVLGVAIAQQILASSAFQADAAAARAELAKIK